MTDTAGKVWFGSPVRYLVNQTHIRRAPEMVHQFFQGVRGCYGNRATTYTSALDCKIINNDLSASCVSTLGHQPHVALQQVYSAQERDLDSSVKL